MRVSTALLVNLPTELLLDIHLLSLNPKLPRVNKHLYTVFHTSSAFYKASYLLSLCRWSNTKTKIPNDDEDIWKSGVLKKVLRYPICDQPTLEALLSHPECPERMGSYQLPKRLFRGLAEKKSGSPGWTEDDAPLPFVKYLYGTATLSVESFYRDGKRIPAPNPNSYKGYALTKAVHAKFVPLIRFLLLVGASPSIGITLSVAVRMKDLSIVKLLVESGLKSGPKTSKRTKRDGANQADSNSNSEQIPALSDTLKCAVMAGAMDVAQYLMQEQGVIPDMVTMLLLSANRSGSDTA